MGRRQALGWLGAGVCSVALIVAGGLVLSSVAVNRYLQASSSAMQRGDAADTATPAAAELASIQHTVDKITAMPGVATATSTIDTPTAPAATPAATPAASGPATAATRTPGNAYTYDVSVIMNPDSNAEQCANVVFMMTQQVQDSRVNLDLSSPEGDGHAASVIDYRSAFDTPVARSTVDAVSQAVWAAASVPGVTTVRVMVPYTWNVSSGDLDVDFAKDDTQHTTALKQALAGTPLAGIDWSSTH